MHIYIYDSFLINKKYESTIAKIETRLTDLGLNGKIIRLGLLQSLTDSIQDEIKKGAKTIVAVGDNALLHQTINAVMSFYNDLPSTLPIPIGFIPIKTKNISLAEKLGISLGVNACDLLSARRIEQLDLGQINNHYFLSEAIINTLGSVISVDHSYSLEINKIGEIAIINMADKFILPDNYQSLAQDGKLEFCIKTKKNNKLLNINNRSTSSSIFSFKELFIDNKKNQQILVDSVEQIAPPATIKLAKQKLNIIVGKNRNF